MEDIKYVKHKNRYIPHLRQNFGGPKNYFSLALISLARDYSLFVTDVIMDMLGNQRMRQFITDYYQSSGEPKLVNQAVKQAWTRERKYSLDLMDGNEGDGTTLWGQIKYVVISLLLQN